MAPRFFGRFEHSLDTKGRVVLPARYRSNFDTRVFLTQHFEKCVALWPPDEFDKLLEMWEQSQSLGTNERNRARVWSAGAAEVEIDRQGRVAIPSWLRDYAGLEEGGEVLVTGAIQHVELWQRAEWDTRVQPSEADLISPTDSRPPPPVPAGS